MLSKSEIRSSSLLLTANMVAVDKWLSRYTVNIKIVSSNLTRHPEIMRLSYNPVVCYASNVKVKVQIHLGVPLIRMDKSIGEENCPENRFPLKRIERSTRSPSSYVKKEI